MLPGNRHSCSTHCQPCALISAHDGPGQGRTARLPARPRGRVSTQDGAPPVGWHDAAAYLVMPVLLVASQYASQKIISSSNQSQEPSQQQAQAILKFLPLMLGTSRMPGGACPRTWAHVGT